MARDPQLTGQRSENSVLFSLREFGGLQPAPQAARPAPRTEGSGLIDIRSMREMMGERAQTRAPVERSPSPAVPNFGDGGLVSLSVDHLGPEPKPPSLAPVAPARPSNGPMYVVLALLGAGILALGAMILFNDPGEVEVTRSVVAAAPALDAEAQAEPPNEPQPQTEPDPAPGEDEAQGAPSEAESASKPKTKTRPRPKTKPKAETKTETKVASKTEPKPADISVDCLLEPKKCAKQPAPSNDPKPEPKPKPDPNLAPKLGQTQILAGIRPVKTSAKSCGSGTTVAIRFSVSGATGKVSSAKALDEHASTSVGACVAKAAKSASFDKFGSPSQGFVFKFRL